MVNPAILRLRCESFGCLEGRGHATIMHSVRLIDARKDSPEVAEFLERLAEDIVRRVKMRSSQ